ncbi:MAG TPA: sensor histidine kinase [Bacteroidales bacterium]|nr:sensor histidine kinase [Bacteroidales bacterium]
MKKVALILIIVACAGIAKAEDSSVKIDSLNKALTEKAENDFSSRTEILRQLYDLYLVNNLPAALSVANNQYTIAKKTSNPSLMAEAESWKGYIYYSQGKNDSSLYFFNLALQNLKSAPDKKLETDVLNNIANIFRVTAKYDTAMTMYVDLLKYYESVNDNVKQGKILANIGSLYYTAANFEKAKEYTLKALEIQRKTTDKRSTAVSLVNLTVFAINAGEYNEGITYGDEAIRLLKDIDKNYYAAALVRVGHCYYMTGNKEKALQYSGEAIDIYKGNNNARGMMEAYRQSGDYLIESGRYAQALNLGKEALAVADTTNRLDMRLLYDMLKRAAIWLNKPEEALFYSQKQITMKEEDLNAEWADKISEIETKYNTEKKEFEIGALKARTRISMILIISLTLILITGTTAAYFIHKNNKQKVILASQRIRELEQEKKITATNSLLEGESAERARLSRDLHDGLGGMLSVAKLKIATMKGNLTIPEENVSSLNSAIELLDTSIKELRRVAHNLMPESLMKFGLNTALADFCRSTGKVTYHFFGEDRRPDEKTEIASYRIVNELVNNSLKHSEAENINVQLIVDENRIHIIVEDDGKGFDAEAAEAKGGTGLKNIRSRVTSLGGKLEMITSPGQGTEVNVEFYS